MPKNKIFKKCKWLIAEQIDNCPAFLSLMREKFFYDFQDYEADSYTEWVKTQIYNKLNSGKVIKLMDNDDIIHMNILVTKTEKINLRVFIEIKKLRTNNFRSLTTYPPFAPKYMAELDSFLSSLQAIVDTCNAMYK